MTVHEESKDLLKTQFSVEELFDILSWIPADYDGGGIYVSSYKEMILLEAKKKRENWIEYLNRHTENQRRTAEKKIKEENERNRIEESKSNR